MHHKHCTQKEVFSCCGFTDNLLWGFTSGIRFISKHEMVNFESKNDFEATVLYFLYFFCRTRSRSYAAGLEGREGSVYTDR